MTIQHWMSKSTKPALSSETYGSHRTALGHAQCSHANVIHQVLTNKETKLCQAINHVCSKAAERDFTKDEKSFPELNNNIHYTLQGEHLV